MNRLTRTLVRTLAALGAAGLALAPSAALAADGTIDHVETKPGTVQLLISVPADADVDLDGVEVTVDGKAADSTAEPADSDSDVDKYTDGDIDGDRHTDVDIDADQYTNGIADRYVNCDADGNCDGHTHTGSGIDPVCFARL